MGNFSSSYSYGLRSYCDPAPVERKPATISHHEVAKYAVAKRRAEIAQEIARLRQRLEQLEAEQADWNKLGS